ncbi:MAG: YkgJ family cysteine cluster protein [Magnetococcales bacterium]|nr:YkgJ family cysteine cluster protein [Magnetococcales bacterium]
MSENNQKRLATFRDMEFEEDVPEIPLEVRDVLNPVRLTEEDSFPFRCHPDVSCFTECCKNIDIVLTPYDILRIRRRLGIPADEFLYNFSRPATLAKGQLPVAMMQMDPENGHCPFVTEQGCTIYEDRPVNCRYYPIGLALMKREQAEDEEQFFFLIEEPFCKGHCSSKQWTVGEWRRDQGTDGYDELNKEWMEMVLKRRSAGDMVSTSPQLSEFFYMATAQPEEFRRFIFSSSFLKRYTVDKATEKRIMESDEEMIVFSFKWLKSVLFGDAFVLPKPEAVQEVVKRQESRRKELLAMKEQETIEERKRMHDAESDSD